MLLFNWEVIIDKLYILRDLDEFKKRYVLDRIKNGNYNIDCNGNIIIKCFEDLGKEKYSHEFILCIFT